MLSRSANGRGRDFALLIFLKSEFRKHFVRLGDDGPGLLLAAQSLHRIVEIWGEHDWLVPRAARQACFDCWAIIMDLVRPFDSYFPKQHMESGRKVVSHQRGGVLAHVCNCMARNDPVHGSVACFF